jgi:DNA-binding transcriptional MerR regulator
MNTHYHIGEFAELRGVSAKTLRFYDEVGVLRPASVDPRTGYRRYMPRQLEQMASILALKNLGVPLSQVGEFTASLANIEAALDNVKTPYTAVIVPNAQHNLTVQPEPGGPFFW